MSGDEPEQMIDGVLDAADAVDTEATPQFDEDWFLDEAVDGVLVADPDDEVDAPPEGLTDSAAETRHDVPTAAAHGDDSTVDSAVGSATDSTADSTAGSTIESTVDPSSDLTDVSADDLAQQGEAVTGGQAAAEPHEAGTTPVLSTAAYDDVLVIDLTDTGRLRQHRTRAEPKPVPLREAPRYLAGVGALAAGVAGLVGVALLVLLGWVFSAGNASAGDALRFAGQVWLLAGSSPIRLGAGSFSIVPLALWAVNGWVLFLGARFAVNRAGLGRSQVRDWDSWQLDEDDPLLDPDIAQALALGEADREPAVRRVVRRMALTAGVMFGSLSVGVALLSSMPTASVNPGQAAVRGFATAAFVFWVTGLGITGIASRRWQAVDGSVRRIACAAAVAVGVLLTAAAVLLAASSIVHVGTVARLWGASDTGWIGGFVLLVVCVSYIPNAMIWAASYLLGTGFSLGTGTTITPFVVESGDVPAVPLFGALPGAPVIWAPVLLALPVLAGVVAGRVLHPQPQPPLGRRANLERAALVVCAVALLGFLAVLAGGSIGPGRLADSGPLVAVGLVPAALLLAIGVWLDEIVRGWRWSRDDSERRELRAEAGLDSVDSADSSDSEDPDSEATDDNADPVDTADPAEPFDPLASAEPTHADTLASDSTQLPRT